MVAKKKKPSKFRIIKPEFSLKALPKKQLAIVKKKPKVANKVKKRPNVWQRQPHQKKLLLILLLVSIALMLVTSLWVVISVKQTNDAYARAIRAAESLNTTDPNITRITKLIGSNEQLTKEIDNYASSPADLQEYTLKDYRTLKQKCIVNGKVYGSLSYSISSVADAQYATIKRNCNGEQTQILKKFGDKWTVVFEGNDPPLCSLVNDLAIPQRVALNCVIGGTTYLNPNP